MEFFTLDEFDFICENIIADSSLDNFLVLYPNPNKGEFTIFINKSLPGNYNVKITNINGAIVYKNEFSITGNRVYINTGNLRSGLYFLHLSSEESIMTTRFIVLRK